MECFQELLDGVLGKLIKMADRTNQQPSSYEDQKEDIQILEVCSAIMYPVSKDVGC